MTVYAVVQLKFKDRPSYDRYQQRFMDVLKPFKGRLLVADETPAQLEGQWEFDKLVMIEFPDEPTFREWGESPACREISRDRKAGADAVVLLARGVGPDNFDGDFGIDSRPRRDQSRFASRC